LVVDIGGATTDVYSVITPAGEDAGLRKDVVETLWRARTVEGDLGMRWNAPGVVAAGRTEHLLVDGDDGLAAYADAVAADPAYLPEPGSAADANDVRLAQLAATVALRRHGRPSGPNAAPRPLKDVRTVIGSGGVLRHHEAAERARILAGATGDHAGGWRVPDSARLVVDGRYVLFAAGLLATSGDAGLLRAGAALARLEITASD
jgi:uncharacterized protein (TIGR01319 family)